MSYRKPKPILTFWGSVTRALDREKPKERHFPAGCRVEAWDFGERQVLVLSGRGQVATYSGGGALGMNKEKRMKWVNLVLFFWLGTGARVVEASKCSEAQEVVVMSRKLVSKVEGECRSGAVTSCERVSVARALLNLAVAKEAQHCRPKVS